MTTRLNALTELRDGCAVLEVGDQKLTLFPQEFANLRAHIVAPVKARVPEESRRSPRGTRRPGPWRTLGLGLALWLLRRTLFAPVPMRQEIALHPGSLESEPQRFSGHQGADSRRGAS